MLALAARPLPFASVSAPAETSDNATKPQRAAPEPPPPPRPKSAGARPTRQEPSPENRRGHGVSGPAHSGPPGTADYRRGDITVTRTHITTPTGRYLIRDLTRLAQSERGGESGLKVGLIAAAVELVILLPAISILNPSLVLALLLPALMIPWVVGYAYARQHPAEFELIATYRGHQRVILFTTSDRQRFGQVARTLLRAMEAARQGAFDGERSDLTPQG